MNNRTDLTVYIAGPMSGMPKLNHSAFNDAEDRLVSSSIFTRVFNPATTDKDYPQNKLEDMALKDKVYRKNVITRDLHNLLECDCIYMLTGWENSKGARVEHALANYLDLKIFYESRCGTC
jgi:hypothetical protein